MWLKEAASSLLDIKAFEANLRDARFACILQTGIPNSGSLGVARRSCTPVMKHRIRKRRERTEILSRNRRAPEGFCRSLHPSYLDIQRVEDLAVLLGTGAIPRKAKIET